MIEPSVGIAIILNALSMGFQADYDWGGFRYLEVAFTLFFAGEIILKCGMVGPRVFWFGSSRAWNIFDTCVVGMAIMDLLLTELFLQGNRLNNVTMFRVARLARLTRMMRLLRLLRLRFFKELAI